MNEIIRTPSARTCLDCDREEYWDDDEANWRIRDDSVGDVHCIHSWDITGTFTPVEK